MPSIATEPAQPSSPPKDSMAKYKQKRSWPRTQTHPFLFTLLTLTAAAELGLTAFLISTGKDMQIWSDSTYRSLLILLCCESAWTLIFTTAYMMWVVDGGAQILANVASSVIWLLLTAVLWGTATGFMHNSRTGGDCSDQPPLSRCRQSLTVEALGWTEFGLCIVTLVATVVWMFTGSSKAQGHHRDSRMLV